MTSNEMAICFSYNLNRMMRLRGFTQCTLADHVGLSRFTIGRYMYGGRIPKIDILVLFVDTLNCSYDDLLKHDCVTLTKAEELKLLRTARKYTI